LNAFEQYYNLDLSHSGEKNRLDFAGSYRVQTTLTSEITDSGILTQLNRHQWLATPSWSYQLTPRQIVTLRYSFQDVSYQQKKNIQVFTDYRNHTFSADWRYQWNPKTEVTLSTFASRYNPVDFAQHVDTLGAQGGVQYNFDETLQGGIQGGIRYTKSESQFSVLRGVTLGPSGFVRVFGKEKQHSTDIGFIFSGNLTKSFEKGTGTLDLSQQLLPLGTGGLVQQLQANLRLRYNLSERWLAIFRATALRNETVSSSDLQSKRSDRTYFSVAPELRWQWTEEISLGLAYTYRYQKFKSIDEAATGNEIMLRLIYQPLKVR